MKFVRKYFLIILLTITIFTAFVLSTNAFFTQQLETNKVVEMNLDINLDTISSETKEIIIDPRSQKIINITINNSSNTPMLYGMYYKMISPLELPETISIGEVKQQSESLTTSGSIQAGVNTEIIIAIINNSNSSAIIELGVNSDNNNVEYEDNQIFINSFIELFPSNKEYTYTEKEERYSYTVTKDGYYLVELWGAGSVDARGAYTSGYIYMNSGDIYYIYTGKKGTTANTNCRTTGYEFNGGGIALPASSAVCGFAGGGSTDIRLVSGNWNDINSLISRIMVAAGAGGGLVVNDYTLGHGGGLYGITPYTTITLNAYLGNGATGTSGGVAPTKYSIAQSNGTVGGFGFGGAGGANRSSSTTGGGSGGGSGYYGGSGSSGIANGGFWGGGGSSFISGYAGVNAIDENTTITHNNTTKHYSGKYFVGGTMQAGVNSDHGKAKITYVGDKPVRVNTKLNDVRYIRDCAKGNSKNGYNNWGDIQAIKDGNNIAKGKTFEYTTTYYTKEGSYTQSVDGDFTTWATTSTSNYSEQCLTVDLGSIREIDEIAVWHYIVDGRAYIDNVTSVSSDKINWTPIMNETVPETSEGKRYSAYKEDNTNGYAQDGLVLWYDGIQNTGATRNTTTTTWKDLSGNGNDGTIYNGTVKSASWGINHLTLDGVNDYVGVAQTETINNLLANGNVTVEVGYSLNEIKTSTYNPLVNLKFSGGSPGYGMIFNVHSIKKLQFQFRCEGESGSICQMGPTLSNPEININTNYHSAGTMNYNTETNTSTMNLYTNGLYEQTDLTASGKINGVDVKVNNLTTLPIQIGKLNSNYANTKIYYVRIYDRSLTKEELDNNYKIDKLRYELE